MQNTSLEFRDLQREVLDLRLLIARQEGEIKQLRLTFQHRAWQTRWQLIAWALSSGGLLIAFYLINFLFG